MPRIAIVAALEREVAPLIRKWKVRNIEHDGRQYQLFENGAAAVICGGMGAEAARRAAEAIIRDVQPQQVWSVGFAGALDPGLKVGEVIEPRLVINVADGVRTDTGCGQGSLVTLTAVAGREQKEKLREAYSASSVDMEAGAVAAGAELRGVRFGAVKVVSDEWNFSMPPVQDFVNVDGTFATARFAMHVAVRPWLWNRTIALGQNSAKATRALCTALAQRLAASED